MRYKALLHKPDCGLDVVESVWLESLEDAERAGTTGLDFYGGTHFTIEEEEEESN